MHKSFIFIFFIATSLYAEIPVVPADGSTGAEVLQVYGAPKSKVEHESHRISIWEYPSSNVYFKEGKVFKVKLPGEELIEPSKQNIRPINEVVAQNPKKERIGLPTNNGLGRRDGKVTAKIMNDLLDNLPKEGAPEKTGGQTQTIGGIPADGGINSMPINPAMGSDSPFGGVQ